MRKLAVALPLAALLAACGGGGGGGGDDAGNTAAAGSGSTRGYTVSGTIEAAAGAARDSDINDPAAPYRPNNSPAEAQQLPNPVTLGGYAAAGSTGDPNDRYADSGDPLDIYRLYLTRDQVVNLAISDFRRDAPAAVDLDLYLYEAGNRDTVVASSLGQQRTETLTVPATGNYLLAVEATAGASNYVLSVGQTALGEPVSLRLEEDFVPGEIVLRMREQQDGGMRALGAPLPRGLRIARRGPAGTALARVAQGLESGAGHSRLDSTGAAAIVPGFGPASREQQLKHRTIEAIKSLRARADIAAASPNYRRQALFIPDDRYYELQWHYPQIALPGAWNVTRGSRDVVVAVVDTGVYAGHPDLAGNLIDGYDFISDADRAGDGDGIDPSADDPGDGGPTGTSSYHGTHVAGIIGAVSDNGQGTAGVAHRVSLMPLRVLGSSGGTSYDVVQALRYAAGLENDSGTVPARPADIINLSLGGAGYSEVEQELFSQLRSRGILVVAAAGNDGTETPSYPAAYEGVVAVSAVDYNKRLAPYSNTGDFVDLAAPGGNAGNDSNRDGHPDGVLSTLAQDTGDGRVADYWFYQGTSAAAPHVAGVMALMKALYPELTPQEFDAALAAGSLTEDLRGDGARTRNKAFGFGLIDAFKAVSVANDLAAGGELPPVLMASPDRLRFAPDTDELSLTVRNAGGGSITIDSVSDNADWLTVTPAEVDAAGLGEYRVSVSRVDDNGEALGNASYPATITFRAEGGDLLEVDVAMQVGPYAAGNTGRLYVLLIDPATGDSVRQAPVEAASGTYSFSLGGVPAGEYFLIAGSDADNDYTVCDAGEACGAWPVAGQPSRLDVRESRTGLKFGSSFGTGLQAGGASDRPPGEGYSRH